MSAVRLESLGNLPALKNITVSRDILLLKWNQDVRLKIVLVRDEG